MNTSALETFARDTRKALMDAVERKLDYVLRADTADLRAAAAQVASLRESARRDRPALVERAAYTWFNRLTALRFLDAKDWHPFGVRVLTAASAGESQPGLLKAFRASELPEELTHFTPVKRLNDLLDGRLPTAIAGADPQGEVYRHLILAACRYYHDRMPFLFEALDDETELLLPDDLLTAHSIAEGFRTEISDDDCGAVEVLGWLYQYYISGKKSIVMARKAAVPSADIPAVTQLFTPHWIVRYLVENSLGRLWLLNRPASKLRASMPYYVEDAPAPSPQPPAPFPHLDRPEDIRLLDPACGSGHMLTYAFDLLYAIYAEEGYPPADIPGLILAHNLHGLEICPRATQLAQFALVCKARERNRNAFCQPIEPQVMCLQNVVIGDGELAAWAKAIKLEWMIAGPALEQLQQFRENTETFGSLIQPVMEPAAIVGMKRLIGDEAPPGDLFLQDTHRKIRLVLDQAEMLSQRYQVVVANPPYMGTGGMNSFLKAYVADALPLGKTDLYGAFLLRGLSLCQHRGQLGMITIPNWLFLSSFEGLRQEILANSHIHSMVHNGRGVWGGDFGSVSFVVDKQVDATYRASYLRLFRRQGEILASDQLELNFLNRSDFPVFYATVSDFRIIPGTPIAYWLSPPMRRAFEVGVSLGRIFQPRVGLQTGDNARFVRLWHEVSSANIGFDHESRDSAEASHCRWFPYNKGGEFRKYYGNQDFVVDWRDDGEEIRTLKPQSVVRNPDCFFRPSVSWSKVSSGRAAFRFFPAGFLFDVAGTSFFADHVDSLPLVMAFANSVVARKMLEVLSPTLNFEVGQLARLPLIKPDGWEGQQEKVLECISLAREDWDGFERSWNFQSLPILMPQSYRQRLSLRQTEEEEARSAKRKRTRQLETENNRLWIETYGLEGELAPDIPEEEITLASSDRSVDMAAFLSYAVGCMMGRYSLDKPGLILADAGDTLEHYLAKVGKTRDQWTFAPDEDGIVPVLDGEWFGDDVVARVREFLRVTFGEATLEENLRFIEDSLGKDLRSYFAAQFYKDHLQTYKKRPIYWLFQSPRKSFQCLVYLHRYTRDTVNRVLNRYLREYLAKMRHALQGHENTLASVAASARDKTRARKEADALRRAIRECEDWERDALLPLAQRRIDLDLDDGVKVNYLKLGDALAPISGLAAPEDA